MRPKKIREHRRTPGQSSIGVMIGQRRCRKSCI